MKYVILGLLASTSVWAQEGFKTWLVIAGATDQATVTYKLATDKEEVEAKFGQKVEIPAELTKGNSFHVTLQMKKDRLDINPCEIDVEQITQFDRSYVCTTALGEPVQVKMRVYTNLNGGDKIVPEKFVAKK